MQKNILFVGAGSMAEAMISGIVKAGIVDKNHLYVTNKQNKARLQYMEETYGVQTSYNYKELFDKADVVFLAMKPKDIQSSLTMIRPFVKKEHLFISVIAGVEIDTIEQNLNIQAPVIRVMPNTSAAVGYSTTAIAIGQYTEKEEITLAEKLMQTIGVTKIVSEEDMHTVTAISGSGPAYVYYFVEAMQKAAKEAGMEQDIAEELIKHTIIGAGKMLEESGESAETLRKNITSEAGTTEAGIASLDADDFQNVIKSCVKQASNRSYELANMYRMFKS